MLPQTTPSATQPQMPSVTREALLDQRVHQVVRQVGAAAGTAAIRKATPSSRSTSGSTGRRSAIRSNVDPHGIQGRGCGHRPKQVAGGGRRGRRCRTVGRRAVSPPT